MITCNFRPLGKSWLLLLAFSFGLSLQSCQENIDDSDYYTFTGEMMTDHFANNSEAFSSYLALLERVKPGKRSESTVASLLRARGNYTCFAPTNEAVTLYIDSLYALNQLESTRLEDIPDSIAQDIVFNSLIDTENLQGFMSTQFEEGVLGSNMNDRPMTISFGNEADGTANIKVNTLSKLIARDIEVENGYIHVVDRVIAPSNSFLGGLIGAADNMKTFAHLLTATGWDEKMMRYRDEEYEDNHPDTRPGVGTEAETFRCPEHKYYGYTAFVETDSVFESLGINFDLANPKPAVDQLKKLLIDGGLYPDATTDDNYREPMNIINQFVAYHLLPMRVPYNQLAIHYNEYGYQTGGSYSVNTFEYYETMGRRRLMKITSGPRTGGYRINRYSEINRTTYREISVPREGILVSASNSGNESNALNGYYYPINSLLVYDSDVPDRVLNERLRYNFAAILPEMITNNLRRPMVSGRNISFPNNFFDELEFDDDTTVFTYLPGLNSGWQNYQGDEFNIVRQYDFTVTLLPVPYAGTYELRFACNNNSSVRVMAQFYIVEDQ